MNHNEFLKETDPTLTEDDLKVIRHLKAIDNIFKRGNVTITQLFSSPSAIQVLKNYGEDDYSLYSTVHVPCDGGDPDTKGMWGIRTYSEWLDLMDERNNQ